MRQRDEGQLKDLTNLNRIIHEPARLVILALLHPVDGADFTFLLRETGLTRGNLSSHLTKLEESEYVTVIKGYDGKIPRTTYSLTDEGRRAFLTYCEELKRMADLLPGDEGSRRNG